MAAAAVIVLAVSLPLLLNRNSDRREAKQAVFQDPAARPAVSQPSASSSANAVADSAPPKLDAHEQKDQKREREAESTGALAAKKAPDPREDRATSEEAAKPQIQSFSQTQAKTEGQVAAPAGQPVPPPAESQVAKDDSDRARQQEKDLAKATETKSGSADESAADKEKARRNEPVAAPPSPPESSRVAESSRPLGRSRAGLGLRDSSSNEAVTPRSTGREIRGKKFFLRDGTWTDKDYNPDKNLPTITLVRDSNVYKEVLAKRSSLKPYLDQFSESERAIIVYKGTVYKLIPQKGSN
jgi:hypothetical protein